MIPPLPATAWVKSSYSSQDGGDCLEWSPVTATTTGTVPVRDSKKPHGPILTFPTDAFTTFVTSLKAPH
ncbi:DUF397 domain-containing protein [Streptomyces albus subsp. chlorinus]|uniref:DUF397 domain-containing protein n=1 Tax=Streptomyces albus TaxID=1888 RepID=UPI0015711C5D|nr:DUF397 domain-containing protein [Streptomyces albus]NSC21956.1 DUF397 domain-containing protein [Streptomyces albus subsp. chlorinus]